MRKTLEGEITGGSYLIVFVISVAVKGDVQTSARLVCDRNSLINKREASKSGVSDKEKHLNAT